MFFHTHHSSLHTLLCVGQHAAASLSGQGVFGVLKHEVGVHRVQRVPVTEGLGRVHTSTMSVVILPQPTQVDHALTECSSLTLYIVGPY